MAADRLYGISMRPHELSLYGDRVLFDLRYSAIFDDADESTSSHFKLMVLEMACDVPADADPQVAGKRIELVKCGWELELETSRAWPSAQLPELPEELPYLIGKIAETVNDLARRAGLEAPFGAALQEKLVTDYRARYAGPAN
ncbi:MAG: hypothetical protein PF961_00400 [Planctomycetota bacterium]|nr:hypothetical protein [Planctomycetota bacterium]